ATTKKPFYLDRKFEYDRTYYYRVSAIFAQNGYTAQANESKIEAVTPRDIFPPLPPAGLEAVYTGRAVQLIWKAAAEANVQGYDIYREGADARPVRLNRSLLHTPVFGDRSARRGATYVYWVTAVDAAGNESLPSVPVTTRTQ
ncbi:MAG: fibronectin type III domain-containing protein, partial [Terriglobia bacterium]